ncbi:transcriptional regulator, TetR family [Alteromonadaceae bacterium Bs31]|nr:transcriptional regulator, TetR family [Alteromonadaceae bacterium Bs31]
MSKREEKKQAILLSGLEVMRQRGYNGTSVKDIVDAAKVPKGSFYNYFDSKEDFVLEAIEYTSCQSYQATEAMLADKSISALERLKEFFSSGADFLCTEEFRGGCFIGTMCQEMSDTSEAVRVKLNSVLGRQIKVISRVLQDGHLDGSIKQGLEPAITAEFIFNAWEGTIMACKAMRSRVPLDSFLKTLPVLLA